MTVRRTHPPTRVMRENPDIDQLKRQARELRRRPTHTVFGGVATQPERWNRYLCGLHGLFDYRHRTRKLQRQSRDSCLTCL